LACADGVGTQPQNAINASPRIAKLRALALNIGGVLQNEAFGCALGINGSVADPLLKQKGTKKKWGGNARLAA
jgi:hypothetical protein